MLFRYEKEGCLGTIILDNPPKNALTQPVFAEKNELDAFLQSDIKGVLLMGAGRHFSSGAEPASFAEHFQDLQQLNIELDQAKLLLESIRYAPVPVVAAIKGSCLGAGLEIALSCHFRFGSETSVYGFPESGYGLMPGLGGTVVPHHHMDRGKLIHLILAGDIIGAEEAYKINIINGIYPPRDIEIKARDYLLSLVDRRSMSLIRATMQSVYNSELLDEKEALAQESKLFCKLAGESVDSVNLE